MVSMSLFVFITGVLISTSKQTIHRQKDGGERRYHGNNRKWWHLRCQSSVEQIPYSWCIQGKHQVVSTHRYTREIPDLYTTSCNGVVSHRTQIGGIRVFTDHTGERKQNVSMIFARHAAFHACLSSRSDRTTYAPDESWLFLIMGKTWIPCRDKNGAGSGIFLVYLWVCTMFGMFSERCSHSER